MADGRSERDDKINTDGDLPDGLWGSTGGRGSGKRSSASNSSWVAPCASFFCCCRLIYWSISSSPRSSSSSTELGAGDGVDNESRLEVVEDVDGFRAGDDTVDVRLWMRGILVGVSLGFTPTPFGPDEGGKSRSFISRLVCELLPPVPTEGDPAIVGSCVRLRNDVSDCRCRELIVCAVARDDMTLLRVAVAEPFEGGVAFRFATR